VNVIDLKMIAVAAYKMTFLTFIVRAVPDRSEPHFRAASSALVARASETCFFVKLSLAIRSVYYLTDESGDNILHTPVSA
jgi:hypothetical protein